VLLDAAGAALLRSHSQQSFTRKTEVAHKPDTCISVEASRWLPPDADDGIDTDADADAGTDDDSCRVMAHTIRQLLLPRTRLFRATSLAGDFLAV
jgi:hypothetical protein